MSEDWRFKGISLAAAGSVLWGASGIAGQYILVERGISPEWLTCTRLICAGAILLLIDWLFSGQSIFSIWKAAEDRWSLLAFALLGMLGTQYTYFAAIKFSNAAVATILQYLMPVIIVGWLCVSEGRLPYRREIFCAVFAVLGTVLLVTGGNWGHLSIPAAALCWGLLSAFCASFYTVQPVRMIAKWRASLVVGWGMLAGGICFLPFAQPWAYTVPWDIDLALSYAFVILLGTVFSFWAYIASVKYIRPAETSIIGALEPLSSILFSFLVFHMAFGAVELIGMFLIILAVYIVSRP